MNLDPIWISFQAMTTSIVPKANDMDQENWLAFKNNVERALGQKSTSIQKQIRLFILLIEWSATFFYLKPFSSLNEAQRLTHLSRFENAPLLKFRQGFWGLKVFVFLGYYGRKNANMEIGYAPSIHGWRKKGKTS